MTLLENGNINPFDCGIGWRIIYISKVVKFCALNWADLLYTSSSIEFVVWKKEERRREGWRKSERPLLWIWVFSWLCHLLGRNRVGSRLSLGGILLGWLQPMMLAIANNVKLATRAWKRRYSLSHMCLGLSVRKFLVTVIKSTARNIISQGRFLIASPWRVPAIPGKEGIAVWVLYDWSHCISVRKQREGRSRVHPRWPTSASNALP